MSVITITEDHLDETKTNEPFTLFLHATNKRVGDKVHVHNFQAWITQHEQDFREQEGLTHSDETDVQRFTEYLKSKVDVEQISLF